MNISIGKKIIKNGIWLYLLQFFNTIIPLVTLPYITRVLGQAGYGTFSIALNIIIYLQVLVEYGFGMSATREVAISSKSQKTLSYIFTSVLCARICLLIASVVIAICYLLFTNANQVLWECLLIMLVSLIGYCVQQNWLFQGMEDMKYISLINIIARTISTLLVFLLVRNDNDIVLYGLLYASAPLLSGMMGVIIACYKYHVRIVRISFKDVVLELKKGWYVFTTQLSAKVFGAIGITFLGIFSAPDVVGAYSAIQKIPNIIMLAWMPISQVLYPITSKKMQESYLEGRKFVVKYQKLFVMIFSLIALVIIVFSKPIVGIAFGAGYSDYFYWVIPLLVWMVVAINNNFLGIQSLLSSGHDKEYSICFQISVIFTIVLNFVFIRLFSGTGAAFAPLASELILMICLLVQNHKIKKDEQKL